MDSTDKTICIIIVTFLICTAASIVSCVIHNNIYAEKMADKGYEEVIIGNRVVWQKRNGAEKE